MNRAPERQRVASIHKQARRMLLQTTKYVLPKNKFVSMTISDANCRRATADEPFTSSSLPRR